MENIKLVDIVAYGIIFIFQVFISLKINTLFDDHDKIIRLEERVNNIIKLMDDK